MSREPDRLKRWSAHLFNILLNWEVSVYLMTSHATYSSASRGGSIYQMRSGKVISLMSQTAPDNLWGTENTTQFHPIGHAPEAPLGKRYWCDMIHITKSGALTKILVRAQRGGIKILSNRASFMRLCWLLLKSSSTSILASDQLIAHSHPLAMVNLVLVQTPLLSHYCHVLHTMWHLVPIQMAESVHEICPNIQWYCQQGWQHLGHRIKITIQWNSTHLLVIYMIKFSLSS